jgi:predicted phage terminase large subunit-like protein
VSALTAAQERAVEAAYAAYGPARLRFCPIVPTAKQEAFLLLTQLEALYGGAVAGGKSVALLMTALQFCDVPGYHALLLRPSLNEFYLPGGLIELAHEWLLASKAVWSNELKQWRFPGPGRSGAGGATLGFGYLADLNDVAHYAGTSYSFLGFDELVRFQELEYRRMLRVLRQPDRNRSNDFPAAADGTTLADVPVRARATSNPGGRGNAWVKARFVDPATRADGAIFLPARIEDNPHLDRDTYLHTLAHLPGAERERLVRGDWQIPDDGELFKREWFEIIDPSQVPARTRAVRYWDLAATEPSSAAPDPDYTVGLRLDLDPDGNFYIRDIVRVRKAPGAIEKIAAQTAAADGREVTIMLEEEPGAAGKHLSDRYKRHVLHGYTVKSIRPTGPKQVRAQPVAAAAQNGLLKIVAGAHLHEFLDELTAFPNGPHDDCVDALAGAHTALVSSPPITMRAYSTNARLPDFSDAHSLNYPTHALARRHWPTQPSRADEELAARIGVPIYRGGW